MKFLFYKSLIDGVLLIEPIPFVDNRGSFRRHFCQSEFEEVGISPRVAQANLSENLKAYTLRGFHYQMPPFGEGKTISCLKGAIYDVVIDIRVGSPTFGQWWGVELTDVNQLSLHVPRGCANAFMTFRDDTLVHYYCSKEYSSEAECGIRYDDPFFQVRWPHQPLVISERDKSFKDFKPFKD